MSYNIIVHCIFSNFFGIKDCGRSFNRSSKSIIVVTLMICHLNNLLFCHFCCVNYNFVMNLTSGCHPWIFICYHVEIKILIVIIKDDVWLHNCSRFRILFITIYIQEKSSDVILIHQNVKNFWVVILIKLFNGFIESLFRFKLCTIIFVWGTSDSFSKDNDLRWTAIFVNFSPIF